MKVKLFLFSIILFCFWLIGCQENTDSLKNESYEGELIESRKSDKLKESNVISNTVYESLVEEIESSNHGKNESKSEQVQSNQKNNNWETEVRKLVRCLYEGDDTLSPNEAKLKLISYGSRIQPILLDYLDYEYSIYLVLEILARIGDENCIGPIIERLPDDEYPDYKARAIIRILYKMTNQYYRASYTDLQSMDKYTTEIKNKYEVWYKENKDYLYTLHNADPEIFRVRIDLEAKLYGVPTKEYRKQHPWLKFAEIKGWNDTEEFNIKLKRVLLFCRN